MKKKNYLPQFSLASWVEVKNMDSGTKLPGSDFWLLTGLYSLAGETYFFCYLVSSFVN